MKNIFGVFWRDLKNILKNPVALIVAIGITILPSLYAWFNIGASWDPYGNTDGVQVAVANTDEGYAIEGIHVNIGDKVIENLKANRQIGWQFMDKEEALESVRSGENFAAVVIPPDFSEKMASILTTEVQRAQIEYYVNEKKNAIAPKITDKGVGVIQQQISQTFIQASSEVLFSVVSKTDEVLQSGKGNFVDNVKETMDRALTDLDGFHDTIDAFISGLDAVDALVLGLNAALPDADYLLITGMDGIRDGKDLLHATEKFSDKTLDTVGDMLDIAATAASNMDGSLGVLFANLSDDVDHIVNRLGNIKNSAENIISINDHVAASLKNLNAALPKPLVGIDKLVEGLSGLSAKEKDLVSNINRAQKSLKEAGELPDELRKDLRHAMEDAKDSMQKLRDTYHDELERPLEDNIDQLYTSMDQILYLMQDGVNGLSNIKNSLAMMSNVLSSSQNALQSTAKGLERTQDKISDMKDQLEELQGDAFLSKLNDVLNNDPSSIGDFMSEPVDIHTNKFYPIANYGSAMTPFYSILAIWVGALILVAIVKTNVKEDETYHDLKPYETYFGRYLLFLFIGLLQAFIICMGDLFLLKIYCVNKVAFVLVGLLASLVFTNIVYTLTLTFSDIGKAVAVILLVLQVAGAGGTFPVEVMPTFFKIINPVLPFTYGINCMRECVGGIYMANFRLDILYLLVFLGISLCIALVFRRPLMKAMHKFEEKMEDSGVM